nr:hypothetical protein [Tanacetum cinerariifolium]
ISSTRDFLGTTPSYTLIRDSMLRLCHRLIAYNIAGRSQAPEKVTVTDLFYLRRMDVGISSTRDFLGTTPSYTLIRDSMLRLCHMLIAYNIAGRSQAPKKAMISGGKFVACMAEHFGLLTEERLYGLTVIVRDLPMIDMAKLVRLQICEKLDDTWAWVAPGPERLQVAMAGAPKFAKDAHVVDEDALAVPAPVHARQPPPSAGPARTMVQRIARLEEDVHRMR